MKKVFALALTVLMVMSMFAGCGSSNSRFRAEDRRGRQADHVYQRRLPSL